MLAHTASVFYMANRDDLRRFAWRGMAVLSSVWGYLVQIPASRNAAFWGAVLLAGLDNRNRFNFLAHFLFLVDPHTKSRNDFVVDLSLFDCFSFASGLWTF